MPDPQQHGSSTRLNSRGLELFLSLGRRLARRDKRGNSSEENSNTTTKNLPKDESSESGSDSTSEIQQRLSESPQNKKKQVCLNLTDSSDTSSDRTSDSDAVAMITSVLKKLSFRGPSSTKKRKQQKSILRRPVCHVHVRGISGLPTQRVPVGRGYYRHPHRRSPYQGYP